MSIPGHSIAAVRERLKELPVVYGRKKRGLRSAQTFLAGPVPTTRAARAVTATVLSKLLNLREQPNANATVIAQLKARESLLVLEEADGWLHVQTCDRAQESDDDVAPVSVSLLALA